MSSPEEMASISAAKASIRSKITKILNEMTLQDCLTQSMKVKEKIFSTPEWKTSKRVSVYLSMDKELQTDDIAKAALVEGKECFVPICRKKKMQMFKLRDVDDLNGLPKNSWGIREPLPVEGRNNALMTGGVDLVITPGVAFTVQGLRLGHGRGYYDQFFKELDELVLAEGSMKPKKFALALKEQILDDVPVSDFDVPVDKVFYSE